MLLLPSIVKSWARLNEVKNSRRIILRCISTTNSCEVRSRMANNRYRLKRPGHSTLLDRFVKQTCMDGSLVAKAPLHFKCAASFFDAEGKVDLVRNHNISIQRDEANKQERINRRREIKEDLEKDILQGDLKEDNGAAVFMEEEDISLMRDVSEVEKNILDKLSNNSNNNEDMDIKPRSRTPIHLCLYGRASHRVDSYSILAGNACHTHAYVSDAATSEDAVSLFCDSQTVVKPSGSVSIWRPREISQVEISSVIDDGVQEEVASAVKVYCPSHLLENRRNGLTMVFHTPTLMNKIYLEGQQHGSIDLNCNLMDQLVSIGLTTQLGNIRLRDAWAEYIKLSTRTGDILCYGAVEGDIAVETAADGDFIARSLIGPRLKVTTDAGDICLWDDCHSEVAELFTVYGNVHCKRLYGNTKILIKEQGTASFNVVTGSVAAVVKNGDIIAHIDSITQDSFIEMGTGNVVIYVAPDFPFRISLLAERTIISSHILNSGEFFLNEGLEHFVSGVEETTADIQPTLTVRCRQGQITLQGPKSSNSVAMKEEIRSR